MLELQGSSLDRRLRRVMTKCLYQQERLRIQKAKLRLQQLKLLEELIEPVRNEAPCDSGFLIGKADSELSWQELGLFD